MALTQKTLNELKQKKIEEVLENVKQQEKVQYEKLMKSPTIAREIKSVNTQMRQINRHRHDIIDAKKKVEELTEGLKKAFEGAGLKLNVERVPNLAGYGFWDEKKQQVDAVEFRNSNSSVRHGYNSYPGEINPASKVGRAAMKKVDDAFLTLKVAVETNNKEELNKAIKEFMKLKIQ